MMSAARRPRSWPAIALLMCAAAVQLPRAQSAQSPQSPQGDDAKVTSRVNAARIGEGDTVTLTVEVRGGNPGNVEEPDLSGLADFTIAAGPSISTSTQMIWTGGKATRTVAKQFSYVLLPRRRGTLTIPTISVRLGGRSRQTDPITVEVVEGTDRGARGGGRGQDRGSPEAPETLAGEVIVESQADKSEAWIGEQVLLTYKIYTQLDLAALPSPQRLPSYTGFWVEEIPFEPRATMKRISLRGKNFLEVTLMKKALFPTASGDLTIEESVFEVPVKVSTRDPFDALFFTPTRAIYRKTAPVQIKVKPLPQPGRPASFSGAVGRYALTVKTDRKEARVNDALGLKITVKGTGNIRTAGEPALPPLPDYKKYDPKVEEKKEVGQDKLSGWKSWDYVLTPLASGQQDIPPIRFSYFDPVKGAYVEIAGEAMPVSVLRAEGGTQSISGEPTVGRREVTAIGRDIRYIKPASSLSAGGAPFHRTYAFASMVAAPILLNAGLLVFLKRREHLMANAGLVRRRRAPAFARRRLKQAKGLLSPERSREFHQEIARALAGYLADKLEVSALGLTQDEIDTLLQERGVQESTREGLRRCLQSCDYARFAPTASGLDQMKSLLDDTAQVIGLLEGQIRTRGAA